MTDDNTDISTPRLYRVILPVKDIDKAQVFYSNLLNQEGRRISSGRHYFYCRGTILACFDPRMDGDDFDLPPNPDNIYFSVKDLSAMYVRTKKSGAEILDEIAKRPWGEISFYIKDPFGNKICFVQEESVFTGE